MKKFLIVIVVLFLISFFIPVFPFVVKKGFNGIGGEFCGIVYYPECDQNTVKFFKITEVIKIIKYENENNIKL